MPIPLYPLRFQPILKRTLWGGDRIATSKHLDADSGNIGESWEISSVPGDESIVAEGALAGQSLSQVVARYGEKLVGKHCFEQFGPMFPLLAKFIDARRDLSIQVHPNDKLAWERHRSLGKSEMWYVINAQPGAQIISGLSVPVTADEYRKRVEEGTITEILTHHEAKPGDVFYLPAGRIHAIGGGVFLAEIQETSNVTYRIYDYGRLDADGSPRELHTELAEDAIDFRVYDDYRTHYRPDPDGRAHLLATPHFSAALHDLDKPRDYDYAGLDSFAILMGIEGEALLSVACEDEAGKTHVTRHNLSAGETLLLPATACTLHVEPRKRVKLLESYF